MLKYGVALVVVAVVAGCGGSSPEETFSLADARRLATVEPVTPDWVWPRNPVSSGSYGNEPGANTTDELLAALRRQLADVAFIGGAGSKWRDETKLGNLAAEVYESVSGAHEAMAALRVFARGWGERSGEVLRDEAIEGLGEEAWRIAVGGNGVQVTYKWRRGNLVLEAHIHCWSECPEDVWGAARTWADAIDDEAQTRT